MEKEWPILHALQASNKCLFLYGENSDKTLSSSMIKSTFKPCIHLPLILYIMSFIEGKLEYCAEGAHSLPTLLGWVGQQCSSRNAPGELSFNRKETLVLLCFCIGVQRGQISEEHQQQLGVFTFFLSNPGKLSS